MSRVNITNYFNAPIGQHIEHAERVSFRMDKDGNFYFDDVGVTGAEHGDGSLPKELDSLRARELFQKALERGYMVSVADGTYRWLGTNDRGSTSELAYFLGRVYGYRHTVAGNAGEDFPEESLCRLFHAKRLYASLTQVYNAQKPQRWRRLIDEIFE
ncbi:MAG: hypothetical protein IKO28_03990 [Prevotella sp.]|nr:hypothetical protein [Prevotella sp.]MBR4572561.1 hypothetical protein [Prevotella sp.]